MDTLLKAAEQKLKQEPTAEVSNDGQNNKLPARNGSLGRFEIPSAYSICFLVVFVFKSYPRTKFAQITFIISVCACVHLAGPIKALDSSITDTA